MAEENNVFLFDYPGDSLENAVPACVFWKGTFADRGAHALPDAVVVTEASAADGKELFHGEH